MIYNQKSIQKDDEVSQLVHTEHLQHGLGPHVLIERRGVSLRFLHDWQRLRSFFAFSQSRRAFRRIGAALSRVTAYQGSLLKSWCTSIEDKNRFYSIEQKFGYPTQETQYMSIQECLPVLVTHRSLELIDPYT